jgi:hypothetical protein
MVSTRVRTLSPGKNGLPCVPCLDAISQQRLQKLIRARLGQRVEPELRVVGLIAPAMLVLGAIIDEHQQPGGGQTLDQTIEQRLGLGIDPVQVLEHQAERLDLAFAQQ